MGISEGDNFPSYTDFELFANVGYLSVHDGFKWVRKERYYDQNIDFLKFE